MDNTTLLVIDSCSVQHELVERSKCGIRGRLDATYGGVMKSHDVTNVNFERVRAANFIM